MTQYSSQALLAPHRTGEVDSSEPLFIVGCGRSGTTMLGQMLNAHSRLAIFHESDFVSLFGWFARMYELRDDATMERFLDHLFNRMTHHPYNSPVYQELDSDNLREALRESDRKPETIFRLLMEAWTTRQNKKRWGDKDTRYPFELPALYAAFPKARFIHIVRDPRAVVASLRKADGAPTNIYRQADVWHYSMHRAHQGFQKIPKDQIYELKYEDLVADPETQLQAICEFIGESFEPVMLDFYKSTQENLPLDEYPTWSHNLDKPVTTQAVEKWKSQLSPEQVGVIETIAAQWMKHYDYQPAGENKAMPFFSLMYAWVYQLLGPLRQMVRKAQWQRRMQAEMLKMQ